MATEPLLGAVRARGMFHYNSSSETAKLVAEEGTVNMAAKLEDGRGAGGEPGNEQHGGVSKTPLDLVYRKHGRLFQGRGKNGGRGGEPEDCAVLCVGSKRRCPGSLVVIICRLTDCRCCI